MPDNSTSSATMIVEEYRLIPREVGAAGSAESPENTAHPRMLIAEEHRFIAQVNGATECARTAGGMRDDAASAVVLVAEDNDADVMMLQRAFRQAGLRTRLEVVQNGEEAIDYLAGNGQFADRQQFPLPILFLLDLRMPRKDGFEVLELPRAQPGLQGLPTVVFTTSDAIKDINRAHELGANSFLTKPLDVIEFRKAIRAIVHYWIGFNRPPKSGPMPPAANPRAAVLSETT